MAKEPLLACRRSSTERARSGAIMGRSRAYLDRATAWAWTRADIVEVGDPDPSTLRVGCRGLFPESSMGRVEHRSMPGVTQRRESDTLAGRT